MSQVAESDSEFEPDTGNEQTTQVQKGNRSRATIIPWADSPKYDTLLLDWLKAHEDARRALFSKANTMSRSTRERGGLGLKSDYYYKAAVHILENDENPVMNQKINEYDKRQLVKVIGHRFMKLVFLYSH